MKEDNARRTAAAVFFAVALSCHRPAVAENILQDMSNELSTNITELLESSDAFVFGNATPVFRSGQPVGIPFNPRGMGMLYNVTPVVIDAFVKKDDFLPDGLVQVEDGHIEFNDKVGWRTLVPHFGGPITFVIFFTIVALLLPITGLFWCCCHMCRIGRRRRPFDRKHDSCLRGLLAILLIALLTLFLFGVVCTFATEQQVEEGIGNLPRGIHNSSGQVRTLLNETATGIHQRVTKYSDYSKGGLSKVFQALNSMIPRQLEAMSHMTALPALAHMVGRLDAVQRALRDVQATTSTLRFQAGQLNAGLRKVKRNLLQTLATCDMPACVNLQRKHRIGELNTDIQYSQMPDVTDLLNNVTALIDGNIKEEVADGQRVFTDIQTGIQRSVDEQLPRMQRAMSVIANKLDMIANEVLKQVSAADKKIGDMERLAGEHVRRAHAEYGPYRRYAGLGVAVSLLLITVLVSWGLVCGVCGKRPDAYAASDCCNKGAGARGLYCGMVLIFLVGGIFCLFTVVYFVVGVLLQRAICDPVHNPQGNSLFTLVDKFANIEEAIFQNKANSSSDFNVSTLIVRCHRNETLYEMFHVTRLIQAKATRSQIESELSLRSAELQPSFPTARIVILRDSAKRKLRMLADSGLSDFDHDRILSALETNMTSLELPSLARTLQRTADGVDERGYGGVPQQLRDAARQLLELQRDIVTPMLRHSHALNETAHQLRDSLRFNHTSLRAAVTELLEQTAQAEEFLNEKGEDTVRQLVTTVTKVLTVKMLKMFDSMVDKELLGRCGPFSAAYNNTANIVCRDLLYPIHGFWLSVGYCALLLVPLLAVCGRLARLYLRAEPYPGPLVEAAYKMDKRYMRGRGGGAACGGPGPCAGALRGAEAVAPPLDAHHARRYNDMAPKHWEEGPPRYHGPATEYERPPPYYYPGPNDRQ
ncbi:prominin-like protein isoform X2 [Amyelois transitella]|uniref:prominin-like protein isoform X2 n=1 Tax=Amyelois transitella TaxID=680683 RepID=UPI00299046DC|nr:prominin-like protein isoform X2 [Amyelois transitella]